MSFRLAKRGRGRMTIQLTATRGNGVYKYSTLGLKSIAAAGI